MFGGFFGGLGRGEAAFLVFFPAAAGAGVVAGGFRGGDEGFGGLESEFGFVAKTHAGFKIQDGGHSFEFVLARGSPEFEVGVVLAQYDVAGVEVFRNPAAFGIVRWPRGGREGMEPELGRGSM